MAQQLASNPPGHNGGIEVLKGVSQAQFLGWLDRMRAVDQAVADAVADRKTELANIKAAVGGKDEFAAFQRARKDAEMSGEARERREFSYRKMMQWQSKPVGFQSSFDMASDDQNVVALNVHLLKAIDHQGEAAGKGGHRRDTNPYTPGTEESARFDQAWLRGQAELAETLGPQEPKRRGRPPGSRNKPKGVVEETERQLDDEGERSTEQVH